MKKDYSGMWLVNGKVSTAKERERVWAIFKKLRDTYYKNKAEMEARHQKEVKEMEKAFDKLMDKEPCTPWVGHVGDVQQEYVEVAKLIVERHNRNAKRKI